MHWYNNKLQIEVVIIFEYSFNLVSILQSFHSDWGQATAGRGFQYIFKA